MDDNLAVKVRTNDKIVLTGNNSLDCVNLSNSELGLERGKLLEKKRVIY